MHPKFNEHTIESCVWWLKNSWVLLNYWSRHSYIQTLKISDVDKSVSLRRVLSISVPRWDPITTLPESHRTISCRLISSTWDCFSFDITGNQFYSSINYLCCEVSSNWDNIFTKTIEARVLCFNCGLWRILLKEARSKTVCSKVHHFNIKTECCVHFKTCRYNTFYPVRTGVTRQEF